MESEIRKLNINDIDKLEYMSDKCNSKIISEELHLNNEDIYKVYGILNRDDILLCCCGLSNADEYISYKYWNDNSKCISELCSHDEIIDTALYYDLIKYILESEENKDITIFFDNNINLSEEQYISLGFISMLDGVLVRVSNNNDNNIAIVEES